MKTILALAALVAVCVANTVPVGVLEEVAAAESANHQRFLEYPDEEGNLHTIDTEDMPDFGAAQADVDIETRNGNNNAYILYTRRNRILSQTITFNNINSLRNSNFDFNNDVIFSIHGWLGSRSAEPNSCMRTRALDARDVNLIIVDWNRAASGLYTSSANSVPSVGQHVGNFCIWLNNNGVPWSRIHLVGFSLGAHIVGHAGRTAGGRIARITGLDPAGPGWSLLTSGRLRASDAQYVECIHTGGGVAGLGINSDIGNTDFFPNGGSGHPGCYGANCDHFRACDFFCATAGSSHLVGTGCSSMTQVTWNTCRGNSLVMGNLNTNKSGSGIYRLTTGRSHPF